MDDLLRESMEITDLVISSFCQDVLSRLIPDQILREEIETRWRDAVARDRKENFEVTKTDTLRPWTRTMEIVRNHKPTCVDVFPEVEVVHVPGASIVQPLIKLEQNDDEFLNITPQNFQLKRIEGVSISPVLVSSQFAAKMFGIRIRDQDVSQKRRRRGFAGKNKSTNFDQKNGRYYFALANGYFQLGNGVIEIFFKEAELYFDDFYATTKSTLAD